MAAAAQRKIITFRAGGEAAFRQAFSEDIQEFTKRGIQDSLRSGALNVVARQQAIGNDPAWIAVDNTRGKSITLAQRKVQIQFQAGASLPRAALAVLKNSLGAMIAAATISRTGKLADMSNWRYVYVRNGVSGPLPGGETIPMGQRDFIVLRPSGVTGPRGNYATVVHNIIAGERKAAKTAGLERRGRTPPKRMSAQGWLSAAAKRAQRNTAFRGFKVSAMFTSKAAASSEISARGGRKLTGTIIIRPDIGRSRGRR